MADVEIRGQATIGGNLCAPPGVESPRGDLQAALIALDAQVRSTGRGGERTESVEDFLAGGATGRLVLDGRVRRARGRRDGERPPPARPRLHGARASAPPASAARSASPSPAPARTAARLTAAEEAFAGGDAEAAAARAADDVQPHDDALASGLVPQPARCRSSSAAP